MAVGETPRQIGLMSSSVQYCEGRLGDASLYTLLNRKGEELFPDEAFDDVFSDVGRYSIPPRVVATVMVLQRAEGLSDRDAVDRFSYDLRWKYAAGGLDYDYPGFRHTVLVSMRARLRKSERPNRIFEATLAMCKEAGLVGRKRIMDSTALYDAVATQDTVTLIRMAIRGLLREAGSELGCALQDTLQRDDDYKAAGKPACEWDDKEARVALVDALSKDAYAALDCLEGRALPPKVNEAMALLATVVGQDIEGTPEEGFTVIRGVAKDRVLSTVDPEARHGHKTKSRSFDGYKGHLSIDADSEIITALDVTAGNVGDGEGAEKLLEEAFSQVLVEGSSPEEPVEVYGDASYGTADIVEKLESAGITVNVKVQEAASPKGCFGKKDFDINLGDNTIRCPQGHLVVIQRFEDGGGRAAFKSYCGNCPLKSQCTKAKNGRTIRIHAKEEILLRNRMRQRCPNWKANYRKTRPKVERKFSHTMRHRHGGRRARVRGRIRVRHDFSLLCAAANLKRYAVLMATAA